MTTLARLTVVIVAALLGLSVGVAASQLVAVGSPPRVVVEFNAYENSIKLSSNIDFASVKITFDDLPGQYVTVAELRGWVKARLPVKP